MFKNIAHLILERTLEFGIATYDHEGQDVEEDSINPFTERTFVPLNVDFKEPKRSSFMGSNVLYADPGFHRTTSTSPGC